MLEGITYNDEGLLVVISAPSGTGKTSLCKAIEKLFPHVTHSISYTTRKQRACETDGKDYYFISEKEFDEMVDKDMFLEHAVVHGHRYGTGRKKTAEKLEAGTNLILDIDTKGAQQLMGSFKEGVYIFLLPPSMDVLANRLRRRGTDDEQVINERLKSAKKEIECYCEYGYIIVNGNFQKALQALEAIIIAESSKVKRVKTSWIDEQFLGGSSD